MQRQAVDRRYCERPSRLRNWSVCTPPRSLVEPHLNLSQFIVLSLCFPRAAFFKSNPFFTSSTYSVSAHSVYQLTTPILAAYCRSIIEYSHQVLKPSLFRRGARIANLRGPGAGAAARDFYTKLLSFIFVLRKAPQFVFVFFSDPTTQLGSVIQGPNTDSDGRFSSAPRPRLELVFYLLYIATDSSDFVCWFACSFVCLFVQICLFLCFFVFFAVQRPRLGSFIYYMYIIFAAGQIDSIRREVRGHHYPSPSARVREGTASYERRDFGLDEVRHMVHNYVRRQPFALCQR